MSRHYDPTIGKSLSADVIVPGRRGKRPAALARRRVDARRQQLARAALTPPATAISRSLTSWRGADAPAARGERMFVFVAESGLDAVYFAEEAASPGTA
jgi:hypothetical protein